MCSSGDVKIILTHEAFVSVHVNKSSTEIVCFELLVSAAEMDVT